MLNRLVHFPIKSLSLPLVGRVFGMVAPFSTFSSKQGKSDEFITVPQDKIQFEINRYKAVGGRHFHHSCYPQVMHLPQILVRVLSCHSVLRRRNGCLSIEVVAFSYLDT